MINAVSSQIEAWFRECSDDEFVDEFVFTPQDCPLSLVDPTTESRFVLYSTKTWSAHAFVSKYFSEGAPAIVGHYGFPTEHDVTQIGDFAGDLPLYFLGDCDPPDILIYAWLRSHLNIAHLGVNDSLVSQLDVCVNDRITIELSGTESHARQLVEQVCPDYETLVGHHCASLLARNHKLEVEAILSSARAEGLALADVIPL